MRTSRSSPSGNATSVVIARNRNVLRRAERRWQREVLAHPRARPRREAPDCARPKRSSIAADLVPSDDTDLATPSVAAALAVLAGIGAAAADAAAARAIARSRPLRSAATRAHRGATRRETSTKDLARLLAAKDESHYGVSLVDRAKARRLVGYAVATRRHAAQVVSAVAKSIARRSRDRGRSKVFAVVCNIVVTCGFGLLRSVIVRSDQLPKLRTRVRFPSPALAKASRSEVGRRRLRLGARHRLTA